MLTLKSFLPFWRDSISSGKAPLSARPEDFGEASSFELLFDRLMDDPEASRGMPFSTRNCRH